MSNLFDSQIVRSKRKLALEAAAKALKQKTGEMPMSTQRYAALQRAAEEVLHLVQTGQRNRRAERALEVALKEPPQAVIDLLKEIDQLTSEVMATTNCNERLQELLKAANAKREARP